MSHIENRAKIVPSLIYAPQKENDEWIFQGQFIEIGNSERSFIHQWLEDITLEICEELALKRNSNRVRFHIPMDEETVTRFRSREVTEDEPSKPEYSSTPSILEKFRKKIKEFGRECICEEDEEYPSAKEYKKPTYPSLDEINEEDVRDTIEELERNIERLRLLGIPLAAIAEFVAKYETISRIKLTDDLRILLPDYDNREVKMGALFKAVYFLFLNHPEGIVLKRLEEYHGELVNYYLQTTGKNKMTPRMIETINTLEYPGNNSINTVLSKIKMYFKATIDEHLARHYYILGSPGEPYKIALENIIIEWEDDYE